MYLRIYPNQFSKIAIKIDLVGNKKQRNSVYPVQSKSHGCQIWSLCHPQFSFRLEWLNVHSQLTGFQHLFNMIWENKVNCKQHVLFVESIRYKMYQLVSKVLTFTKIPNWENQKNPNQYLLEMLNTKLTFAIPKCTADNLWNAKPAVQQRHPGD